MSTEPNPSTPLRAQIQLVLAVALVVMAMSVVGTFIVTAGFENETVIEIVGDFRVLIIMGVGAALAIFGLGRTVSPK